MVALLWKLFSPQVPTRGRRRGLAGFQVIVGLYDLQRHEVAGELIFRGLLAVEVDVACGLLAYLSLRGSKWWGVGEKEEEEICAPVVMTYTHEDEVVDSVNQDIKSSC